MTFKGPIKTAQACKPGIFGDLFYGEIPKENGTGSRNLCAVQDVLKTFPAEFLQFNIQILVADGKASGNRRDVYKRQVLHILNQCRIPQ